MTNRLFGEHVLVTGAGSGIGAAVALTAARRGLAVTVNDLDGDAAAATAGRIRAAGGRAAVVPGDVSSPEGAAAIVAGAVRGQGDLTGLVNNAGIVTQGHTIEHLDARAWERVVQVNLLGCAYVTHSAFPSLKTTRGAIVNLASIAAFSPSVGVGGYSASKAGVAALTAQTALEGGPFGIRANAIAPGFISGTRMTAAADADMAVAGRRAAAVPLRRQGQPEDIADVALFLLSDEARCVSGVVLLVDGGLHAALLSVINFPNGVS